MNRAMLTVAVTAALIAAVTASLCTLVAIKYAQPEVVQAAPQPRPGMQVATVNLEELARLSRSYAVRSKDWELIRNDLAEQNKRSHDKYLHYKHDLDALLDAGVSLNDDRVLDLLVELQAREEAAKAAKTEQRQYLAALLDEYQKEVLEEVLAGVKRYARENGFDLVLQTYSISEAPDFFADGTFVQRLMSQTVLDAPGAEDLSNAHVTDITDKMISFMQNGGIPEPQPENEKEK